MRIINKNIIFSHGLKKLPHLNQFLKGLPDNIVLGWGNKPNTAKPRAYAQKHGLVFYALEDGFLRSLGLGVQGDPPLSLVIDDLGIYYDFQRPSRLENLILDQQESDADLADAQKALDLIIENQLSKYNHAPDALAKDLFFDDNQHHVLVVDQTAGDMSLQYGGASADTFIEMLESAIAENPQAKIWLKVHPDVLTGKKQGHFSLYRNDQRIHWIADDVNPMALLKKMNRVYVATSQMGFEALMLGKSVVTFGVPWYSGWGLTDDRHSDAVALAQSSRRRTASLLELFNATYLQYCQYLNPFSKEKGTIFDVIDYLILAKRRNQLLSGDLYCLGLSWWKRQILRPFIKTPHNHLHFIKKLPNMAQLNNADAKLLLWGRKHLEAERWAIDQQLPMLRMEDGFIRSVGLGSNLVPPLSLVFDDQGIYFDCTQASRLESLLNNTQCTRWQLEQGQALIASLLANNISKYNVGIEQGFQRPSVHQRVILIPGQVEDDASIKYGTLAIHRNLDLIKRVRADNPQAYLIYKTHPDVSSGNRQGAVDATAVLQYVDHIEKEMDILSLMNEIDELHTMTSLSGFEALLRGKKVVCYGAPFYAGWGLTEDYLPVERRQKTLTLHALVYIAMCVYPVYINPNSGDLIRAQDALQILVHQKRQQVKRIHHNWMSRRANQIMALVQLFYRH